MLIGTLPAPITPTPLVILLYAAIVVMLGAALASVLLDNSLYAIGGFGLVMVMVALLYLVLAPVALFLVQLVAFTTVTVALALGVLRTGGQLRRPPRSPFSRDWIPGTILAAALFALIAVVTGTASWPVRAVAATRAGFAGTLADTYLVAIATLVVVAASAALGVALLLRYRVDRRPLRAQPSARPGGPRRPAGRGDR